MQWQPIETAPKGRERFVVAGMGRLGWWADANAYRAHKPLERKDGSLCEIVYDGWSTRIALCWANLPDLARFESLEELAGD